MSDTDTGLWDEGKSEVQLLALLMRAKEKASAAEKEMRDAEQEAARIMVELREFNTE